MSVLKYERFLQMASPSRCEESDDGISIPDELLTEIFLRMPPERAIKLRCLSKFCRGIIESNDFIRRNYDLSIKTTPSVILRRKNRRRESTEFLVDFDPTKSVATVRKFIKPCINEKENVFTQFLGCSRGILCYNILKDATTTCLAFWNPYTGVYRRSLVEHVGPTGCSKWAFMSRSWSLLGYDNVIDDLKVLKITQYQEEEGDGVYAYAHAYAIYSSRTDSWRRVEGLKDNKVNMGNRVGYSDNRDIYLEDTNCVYMLATLGSGIRAILCFDFASEKFNLVSVPEHWRVRSRDKKVRDMVSGLSSLNGCLCMYYKPTYLIPRPDYLDVWMMKQYGKEESWERVFYLSPCGRSLNLIPLIFTSVNNGRQLLVLSSKLELGLYLCNVEDEKQQLEEALHVIQPENSQSLDYSTQHYLFVASCRQP